MNFSNYFLVPLDLGLLCADDLNGLLICFTISSSYHNLSVNSSLTLHRQSRLLLPELAREASKFVTRGFLMAYALSAVAVVALGCPPTCNAL
jgi:hypothetical protein